MRRGFIAGALPGSAQACHPERTSSATKDKPCPERSQGLPAEMQQSQLFLVPKPDN
jgi:hypothetical protein